VFKMDIEKEIRDIKFARYFALGQKHSNTMIIINLTDKNTELNYKIKKFEEQLRELEG